jgi:hypothetical protein
VAAAVGKHLFAALLAEGIEALAALLLQRVALGVAQLVAADQAVGAVAVGGDAVAGEHLPHHPFHAFGGVLDLGHVFAQDPPGHVLRWGGAAAAEQFHEHERLVDVAHSHLLGDVLPEALKGAERRWKALEGAGRRWKALGGEGMGDAGGCRALGPVVAFGGPSGRRPCWDPFWRGRVAAAAKPAPGLAVPTQPPIHG